MSKAQKTIEVEGLTIDRVIEWAEHGETVVLTRDGQPLAAVTAIQNLQRLYDERELLRRLALGELESAAGEGTELESVLEDCRLLLDEN